MKLLRSRIDVNQQHVVQQQILNEVILVKPLFIRNQKILNLKSRNLPHFVNVFVFSLDRHDIFYGMLIEHFKILISLNQHALCLRVNKIGNGRDLASDINIFRRC